MQVAPVTDDDWGEALRMQEERLTMREKARIEQRKLIWAGFGYLVATAIVVAGVFGIGWLLYDTGRGTREGDTRVEHERTLQVQACVQLGEPLERQYCLMSINAPEPT